MPHGARLASAAGGRPAVLTRSIRPRSPGPACTGAARPLLGARSALHIATAAEVAALHLAIISPWRSPVGRWLRRPGRAAVLGLKPFTAIVLRSIDLVSTKPPPVPSDHWHLLCTLRAPARR